MTVEDSAAPPTCAERVVAELAARGWAEVDYTALDHPYGLRSWTKDQLVFHLRVGQKGRVCGAWSFRGKASDMVGATSADTIGVTRGRDKFGQAMALLERIDQFGGTEPNGGSPQ